MEHISCIVCNSKEEVPIYQSKKMRVVACRKCTLAYMNPRPTEQEMEAFYQSDYQTIRHGKMNYEQAVKRQEEKQSKQKKAVVAKQFLPYLKNDSLVVEIGSGWGALLSVVKDEKNAKVIGLELSDQGREVAEKYYKVEVHKLLLHEWYQQTQEQPDAIIMSHVLEHIYNPFLLLKEITSTLKQGGILYIAVPDIMKPEGTPEDYYRIEHAYHFSPYSLEQVCKMAGLKIIDVHLSHNDMRFVLTHEGDSRKAVDTSQWNSMFNIDKVLKANLIYQRKYNVLKKGKEIVRRIVPRKIFSRIHSAIVYILKRCKIITY